MSPDRVGTRRTGGHVSEFGGAGGSLGDGGPGTEGVSVTTTGTAMRRGAKRLHCVSPEEKLEMPKLESEEACCTLVSDGGGLGGSWMDGASDAKAKHRGAKRLARQPAEILEVENLEVKRSCCTLVSEGGGRDGSGMDWVPETTPCPGTEWLELKVVWNWDPRPDLSRVLAGVLERGESLWMEEDIVALRADNSEEKRKGREKRVQI